MKKAILAAVALVGFGLAAETLRAQSTGPSPAAGAAEAGKPTRRVKGRTLVSAEMPAVRIEFDKAFKYAGGHSFILYDVARAEQHFFVDADREGRVRRMYWVQFEGYLPTNTHAYRYRSNQTVQIGGLDFIADSGPRNLAAGTGRPDSDGSRARDFLASKGFRPASDDILSQRLVHLIDEAKRNELMIIYVEDLGGTGLKAADLAEGGSAAARWGEISKGLLERAVKGLKVS
ncbi:MAG: hypothetical protein ACRD68_17385, partial [Pyrinomonadaceae bacterium]